MKELSLPVMASILRKSSSTLKTALSAEQQAAVESDLGGIIRALAGDALDQAIPSLPVPAELPAGWGT